MAKALSTKTVSGYHKYFDGKSLKNVASCAAIIFIIVHLIDYLWNFTIPLRVLNIITLSLCLLITFLFVVNELVRLDEKIILGIANAALLFFSVIGFNSTITSNVFTNARNTSPDKHEKIGHLPGITGRAPYEATMFAFFEIRNWMPPAKLENQLDTLIRENQELRQSIKIKADSLELFSHVKNIGPSPLPSGNEAFAYKKWMVQFDSLQQVNVNLQDKLQKCLSLHQSAQNQSAIPPKIQDTSFMDKTNYINSYRAMKEKFEADLKKCQREADEYRSKYNILTRGTKQMMERVRGEQNQEH